MGNGIDMGQVEEPRESPGTHDIDRAGGASPATPDWRLTPREELFSPPPHGEGDEGSSKVEVISHTVMHHLARGEALGEMRMIGLARALAEQVLSNDENPLSGFSDLMESLYADYAYYDADQHLEGFSEGVAWGMTKLARVIVDMMDSRSDRFLPPSALLHPDVLMAVSESLTMDVDRLMATLGIAESEVIEAIISLHSERLAMHCIMGQRRFFSLSRHGEDIARRLREMEGAAIAMGGDPVDAMMGMSDFTSREAVARCIQVIESSRDGI